LIVAAVAGGLVSSVKVADLMTTTDLGATSVKLGKTLFDDVTIPSDSGILVTPQNAAVTAVSSSPPGDISPGEEATSGLPSVNTTLIAGNFSYKFELREAEANSFQAGDAFRIEVTENAAVVGVLYFKQDTVDDAVIEGISVEVDLGADPGVVSTTIGKRGFQTLTATQDTWVDQKKSGSNHGTDTTMDVRSKTNQGGRALVEYDVSSIPTGSAVDSALLRLCATVVPNQTRTYDAFRVTAAWAEASVTWDSQPTVAAAATASTTTPASSGCMTWMVTVDVQAWADGAPNNGLQVTDDTENDGNYNSSFRTRESTAVPADQPRIDVVYYAP
jgi:hypothetical protein